MKRILILGGGFGGLATAHRLKQKLAADDEVVLVDQRAYFMVGFRKTWALVGVSPLEAGQRPLDRLTQIGVQVIRDSVTAIDPKARTAEVGDRRIEADAVVVASAPNLRPRPCQACNSTPTTYTIPRKSLAPHRPSGNFAVADY